MQKLKETWTSLPFFVAIHSDIACPVLFHVLLMLIETHQIDFKILSLVIIYSFKNAEIQYHSLPCALSLSCQTIYFITIVILRSIYLWHLCRGGVGRSEEVARMQTWS